jgi:hypothetical protein
MRGRTTPHRRRVPLKKTLARITLVAAALAAPATGEPADTEFCPPSFECGPRMKALLAMGMEQSETLRYLVERLSSHPGVSLDLKFRRPRPETRAQSELNVSGFYAVENGERVRRVTGVSGVVNVPFAAYGHRQIGLIAHELAHILIRLRGGSPITWAEEEREATEFEAMVLVELDSSRAVVRKGPHVDLLPARFSR